MGTWPGFVMFTRAWAALMFGHAAAHHVAEFLDLTGEGLHLGTEVIIAAVGLRTTGVALLVASSLILSALTVCLAARRSTATTTLLTSASVGLRGRGQGIIGRV